MGDREDRCDGRQSRRVQTRRRLDRRGPQKASQDDPQRGDQKSEIKEQKKLTGQIAPVPHYNVEIAQAATNVTHFPHLEKTVAIDEIAAVTPIIQPPAYDPSIVYWQAVAEYSSDFAGGVDEAKEFLLGLFPGQSGEVAKSEVESAIAGRHITRKGLLKAV
jgi:hypothetical protein